MPLHPSAPRSSTTYEYAPQGLPLPDCSVELSSIPPVVAGSAKLALAHMKTAVDALRARMWSDPSIGTAANPIAPRDRREVDMARGEVKRILAFMGRQYGSTHPAVICVATRWHEIDPWAGVVAIANETDGPLPLAAQAAFAAPATPPSRTAVPRGIAMPSTRRMWNW